MTAWQRSSAPSSSSSGPLSPSSSFAAPWSVFLSQPSSVVWRQTHKGKAVSLQRTPAEAWSAQSRENKILCPALMYQHNSIYCHLLVTVGTYRAAVYRFKRITSKKKNHLFSLSSVARKPILGFASCFQLNHQKLIRHIVHVRFSFLFMHCCIINDNQKNQTDQYKCTHEIITGTETFLPEHLLCLPSGIGLVLPSICVLLPVVHFSQFGLDKKIF